MSSKRPAGDAAGGTGTAGGPPAKKKMLTQFEPIKIGSISTLEEMDMKVLQFQNKKLCERIEQRRKAEDELRQRIDQLVQRQTTDDAVLCIVNRYWNQLDEDVRVLLQRFDAEGADESEKKNESGALTSFLLLLSQWEQVEIEERLHQRVEFSKRAIGKLLQAYDRLLQRNQKLRTVMRDRQYHPDDSDIKEDDIDIKKEIEDIKIKKETLESDNADAKSEVSPKKEMKKEGEDHDEDKKTNGKPEPKPDVSDVVLAEMDCLQAENKRLHDLVTELHRKNHSFNINNSENLDKLSAAETEAAELKNNLEEVEYNCQEAQRRLDKYDKHLAEAVQKLKTLEEGSVTIEGGGEGVSKNKYDEIHSDLEEQKELATNRLTELEKLQRDHQSAVRQLEQIKMDLSTLPEHVIVETTDYKCLQSQFSVMFNEQLQMKTQLEDTRNLLQTSKNANLRHIEEMEGAELEGQKKLRTDFIQLEDQLAQVRREYEMLRIEFEQTLTANEQTGPINREMRHLITSLKNHNEQLKGEVARYKRKLKEAHAEISKYKTESGTGSLDAITNSSKPSSEAGESSSSSEPVVKGDSPINTPAKPPLDETIVLKKEEEEKEEREREKGKTEVEIIKDLKVQLKKSQDSQKEMKLLLDMYKSVPKESRDKVTLMASEKRAQREIEDLKSHIRKMTEAERKERRKLAEEDAIRKIKRMEDLISELQKNLTVQKQEEEALLSEMEVTGQAFEDMQEQNIRLIQQLKEKDDANFKLMSERIKSSQMVKLLREEKDVLSEQVGTLQAQVEAQNQVVRKLEEKERILQNNLATVEKELILRQQGMELHKRKAVESAQTAADLKLHLDKYHSQLKEAQNIVTEKTGSLQQETFKHKRMHEDVSSLRRKLERAKKIEMASSADEVLMEEIREYKEQLTCPSCKVKKKDAVLTKCFHVFCLECLKTRYETRQRKCPKCNATFGANDFHRLYIS